MFNLAYYSMGIALIIHENIGKPFTHQLWEDLQKEIDQVEVREKINIVFQNFKKQLEKNKNGT